MINNTTYPNETQFTCAMKQVDWEHAWEGLCYVIYIRATTHQSDLAFSRLELPEQALDEIRLVKGWLG